MNKRICFSILFIAILIMSCAKRSSYNLIIPGESVGKINAATTEKDLARIFYKQSIIDCELLIGEGESIPGTMISDDMTKSSIAIAWKDVKLKSNPKEIRILGNKTMLKTSDGVTLGTSLKELEKINGVPFKLMGFEWDYQGTFINSNNGKLSYLDRTGAIGYGNNGGKMLIRLQPQQSPDDLGSSESYKTVLGDRSYSSNLPAMQEINPVVTEMIIYFP